MEKSTIDTNTEENEIDSICKQIKELRKIAKEWEYNSPKKANSRYIE